MYGHLHIEQLGYGVPVAGRASPNHRGTERLRDCFAADTDVRSTCQPSSTRAARYSRVERAPGITRDSKTTAAAIGARRAI